MPTWSSRLPFPISSRPSRASGSSGRSSTSPLLGARERRRERADIGARTMTEAQGGESRVRILHLEDDPNDAELIRAALEGDRILVAVEHVTSREEFTAAVERGEVDLILSDYSLPGFDGAAALHIVLEKRPDVPFIIVSGQLGAEAAAATDRGGTPACARAQA